MRLATSATIRSPIENSCSRSAQSLGEARGHEQLAIGLLFGVGVLLGLAVAPLLSAYAKADPNALYESAGTTTLFVGALGAYGYATRRDLSSWARTLFWALER